MKLTNVTLERTYNLGNYESLRIGLEASLADTDNPLNVLKGLEDMAELYLQTRLSRDVPPPKTQPQPPQEPKETAKPEAPQQQQPTANEAVILSKFPEHLRQHLTISENGRIIRTKFVSKDYWKEMNFIAKNLGYKWWTNSEDKKQSRWEKQ